MFPPGGQVLTVVDRLQGRPRLRIDVLDLLTGLRANNRSIATSEGNTVNLLLCFDDAAPTEKWNQFFESQLALADHDDIGTRIEIFLGVGSRLRTTNYGLPSGRFCRCQDLDDVAPRHQIGIHAQN